MNKLFILFFILLVINQSVAAQQLLRGKLQDSQTRKPVVGATIAIPDKNIATTSGEDGHFQLQVPTDAANLFISRIGYQAKKINIPQNASEIIISLDRVETNLQEVNVIGYETNRPLLKTAGAIGLLTAREIDRFNYTSLVPAINTIPGVRMEERATASYRFSIRGSTLRAPFGVRNVKIYLNNVPLVEANNTLPVNLLDAGTIGQVEVIKGPAGSVYGAGTGGTVLLETVHAAAGETSIASDNQIGSFGLRRHSITAATGSEKADFLVQYAKQKLDGYRQQSAMNRDIVLLSGRLFPTGKQQFSFHTYYSKLYYEIPGALTLAQYEANPKQASPRNVEQNASINLNGLNIGLNHQYQFNERWSNSTSLFGVFSFLDHPFTNDYERNANQAFGGRTKTSYRANLGSIPAQFSLGAEWQHSFISSRHYESVKGFPGSLNYDDEVTGQQGFIFTQTELELPYQFIATLGASLNRNKYDITRVTAPANGDPYTITRKFKSQFSPRLGLVKLFTPNLSAHGSISYGFSPPTEAEIRPSDGSLNTDLNPERGVNYEAGLRGNIFNNRLQFDLVGFKFNLKETIVNRTTQGGTVVFQNAGTTNQKGIETALSYVILQAPEQNISHLKIWNSYTFNHFRFQDYRQLDKDFSGNKLTGSPAHVVVAGLDAESKIGFYLNATANYTSEIPLNDANTVYAKEFFILGSKAGFRHTLGRHWLVNIYAGLDNAFDKTYSLGNDLNGFGNRYFQAAPGRNYFTGLQLKYLVKR